jgi:hypothetical protein
MLLKNFLPAPYIISLCIKHKLRKEISPVSTSGTAAFHKSTKNNRKRSKKDSDKKAMSFCTSTTLHCSLCWVLFPEFIHGRFFHYYDCSLERVCMKVLVMLVAFLRLLSVLSGIFHKQNTFNFFICLRIKKKNTVPTEQEAMRWQCVLRRVLTPSLHYL